MIHNIKYAGVFLSTSFLLWFCEADDSMSPWPQVWKGSGVDIRLRPLGYSHPPVAYIGRGSHLGFSHFVAWSWFWFWWWLCSPWAWNPHCRPHSILGLGSSVPDWEGERGWWIDDVSGGQNVTPRMCQLCMYEVRKVVPEKRKGYPIIELINNNQGKKGRPQF